MNRAFIGGASVSGMPMKLSPLTQGGTHREPVEARVHSMILIVGATGHLGSALASLLLNGGTHVRVLTRDAKRAQSLRSMGAQVYVGDLRDADSLARACRGVEKVFAAAHSFMGSGDASPKAIDGTGNQNLMNAAARAGVEHFVFVSAAGVRADHPIDFFRIKHESETYLRNSGLRYSILRPSPFMDVWAVLVGEPILKNGRTKVFGRGANPISFIAASDVAHFGSLALRLPELAGETIELGGPEALTMNEVAVVFARFCGRSPQITHVAPAAMHLMAGVTGTMRPAFSRQVQTSIMMDTEPMVVDSSVLLAKYPHELTTLESFIATRYGKSSPSVERKSASV
jgi:uncharacterized protein YbjT (DUF2867 family)